MQTDELNDDPGQNQELLPENGNDVKIQLEKVMIVKMDDVLRKLANVTSHRIQKKRSVYIPVRQLRQVLTPTTSEMIPGTPDLLTDNRLDEICFWTGIESGKYNLKILKIS